jgi:HK97 family phage portal protein
MDLASLLFPAARADGDTSDQGWRPFASWFGPRTRSGEDVTPATAMTLSTYFACVRNLSEDLGKLPFMVYREEVSGRERVPGHPMYQLLHDAPNPETTSMTFRETLTSWAASWGNGYAEIQRDGRGLPVALWPIHPSRVRVHRDIDSGALVYDVSADVSAGGIAYGAVRLRPEDVLHIHGLGDGVCGYSVLRFAAESLGVGLAAQSFGAAFFANGAAMSGILTHPGKLEDKARANLRESWAAAYGGARKAGATAVLEEGVTYERTSVPPDEAQFLETRQFQVEEVCRWFRMPPHKVQNLLRSTFSNIEAQNTEYVIDTLMAWAVRWEQEVRRKLLAGTDLVAEILFTGMLRGDQNARANFYRTMVNIGALSPNEVREAENLNDGGTALDRYYMQSNMLPLEFIGTTTTRSPAITDGPAPSTPAEDPAAADVAARADVGAQIDHLRPLFLDACSRVLHREVVGAAPAGKKYSGNARNLRNWADEFYAEQHEYLRDALAPAVTALAGVAGVAVPDLNAFARDHADASRAAFLASGGAEMRVDNTPAALADQVIDLVLAGIKEPAHVSRP